MQAEGHRFESGYLRHNEFCETYIDATKRDEEVGENMNNFENVRIFIPPNELWKFYTQNKGRCQKEMILIAENTETCYAVYMTDDSGTLTLSVCHGDNAPEYEERVMGNADCEASAKRLFTRYLIPLIEINGKSALIGDITGDVDDDDFNPSMQDVEDEMYEREDELDLAIKDFLAVVLQEPDGEAVINEFGETFIQEVLHHFLEYLTNDHGIQIYRPMFFEDDSGYEIYSQFPYEEYTFSGEAPVMGGN